MNCIVLMTDITGSFHSYKIVGKFSKYSNQGGEANGRSPGASILCWMSMEDRQVARQGSAGYQLYTPPKKALLVEILQVLLLTILLM